MHLSMMIWFYKIPLGFQRQMQQKDIDYQNQLKLQTYSNGCLKKIHNKDHYGLLNEVIKDRINNL